MFTASTFCALLVAASFQQAGRADLSEMVARKLKMGTTYRVQMRVESRQYVGQHLGRSAYTASIWRAGDKIRIDITDAAGDPPPPEGTVRPGGEGAREVNCHNCERPGHYLITSVAPGNPKITRVVGFDKTPALACYFTELDIDWRFLGMTNNTLHAYNRIPVSEDCQNYATNPKRVLSQSVRNTKTCLVSSLTAPNSQSETYFSVEEGHNPVCFAGTYKSDRGQSKLTTEIDWRKTPGGHLYPSRIRRSETNGGQLQSDDTITVIDADFHNPVDPSVFTLAGMNLNDGQLIAFPEMPPEKQPRWRNGGLAPR